MMSVVARLLYTKPICKLTEREWSAFKSCNMGTRGSMMRQVQYLRDNDRQARAILCWEGKTLVGCACIFGTGENGKTIYTYVPEKYRRQGIGTAIVAHARRGRKLPLRACPWDMRSQIFYDRFIEAGKCVNAYLAH